VIPNRGKIATLYVKQLDYQSLYYIKRKDAGEGEGKRKTKKRTTWESNGSMYHYSALNAVCGIG
jgi:hypothetical protein